MNCGPRGLPTGFVRLYHNNGDGTFTDVSKEAGVAEAEGSYPMTAVAADFDGDGWPDIYVACDSTLAWLFRNQHDGTFRQEGSGARGGGERGRLRAGGHGHRGGRLRSRREPRHLEDALLRRYSGSVPRRRERLLRRRHHPCRSGRGDPVRLLGHRDRRSRQRRLAGPVRRHRERLPRGERSRLPVPDAPAGVPQPRQRSLRGADRRGRTRCGRGPQQPGLRLRGFRQRRGRGCPGGESERAAVAAAQRPLRRPPLAEGPPRRRPVEPQRDRRAGRSPPTAVAPRRNR